jgi:hypothetical protein
VDFPSTQAKQKQKQKNFPQNLIKSWDVTWWHGMKREIAFYIARCDVCQRVKAEHERPVGLLQPLKVPVWK